MTAEPLPHGVEHVGSDLALAPRRGHDDPSLGIVGDQLVVSVEDALVERRPGALEAIEVAIVESVGDNLGVGVDEHDERRPHPLDGPVVESAQLGEVELATVTLVGERRVHAAIADDGATGT